MGEAVGGKSVADIRFFLVCKKVSVSVGNISLKNSILSRPYPKIANGEDLKPFQDFKCFTL
jgi:hypothetical protein